MSEYPTEWQKKTIWGALSTLSVVTIGAVSVGLIWLTSQVLGFLQPILIPFAGSALCREWAWTRASKSFPLSRKG